MIPLFKTDASIGGSLLTVDDVINLQKEHSLDEVVVVETAFYNFRKLNLKSIENNFKLVFGIQLPVVQEDKNELKSKLVFFAKNSEGLKQIKNLYSKTYCSEDALLVLKDIKKEETSDVLVGVPFYDSFVYQNIFHFGLCDIKLDSFDHFFIEENNGHPFDIMISKQLKKITKKTVMAKTILYKKKADVDAFQFYKAVCNRSGGKTPTYNTPNLNDFCSDEFCWESYLEKK